MLEVIMHKLCILAIFKNESWNLREWLEHYSKQGVDYFFLIDNGSTDNYQTEISGYPVTLIKKHEQYRQIEHYNEVYKNIKHVTEWLIIVDIDEFFYARNGTLKNYLKEHENCDVIYSNWKMFGSRDEYENPKCKILETFKHRSSQIPWQTKGIIKCEKTKSIGIHFHETDGVSFTDNENLQLNHYSIQSKEFFEKIKMTRGDALFDENSEYGKRNWDFFKERDVREIFDDEILRVTCGK